MQLNLNCVRDILVAVEGKPLGAQWTLTQLQSAVPEYTEDDVVYTCLKLQEGGFLEVATTKSLRNPVPIILRIRELTFAGHEFLADIKSDTTWNKVLNSAKKAGVSSLKSLMQIAQAVAAAAISSALLPH